VGSGWSNRSRLLAAVTLGAAAAQSAVELRLTEEARTGEQSPLLARVESAVGPAAATMFVERDRDRHFILETALAAVALYLAGKYLEGFVEGLGIPGLGRKHGEAIAAAVRSGLDGLTRDEKLDRTALEQPADALSATLLALHEHRSDVQALASGKAGLVAILEERDIPSSEAERIAEDVGEMLWRL
jgi:hypothetical protein